MVYPKLLRFLKAHICTTPGPACTDPIRKLECILRCVDTAKYCTSVLPGAQANPQTGPPVNIMHMRSVIVRRKNKHCEYSQDFLPFFFSSSAPGTLFSTASGLCSLFLQTTNQLSLKLPQNFNGFFWWIHEKYCLKFFENSSSNERDQFRRRGKIIVTNLNNVRKLTISKRSTWN